MARSDPFRDFSTMHPVTVLIEQQEKATAVLEGLDQAGVLLPIPGWEGSVLDGYLDVLGLNGRPVKDSLYSKAQKTIGGRLSTECVAMS